MKLRMPLAAAASVLALASFPQTASARLYDSFNASTNWNLTTDTNSGGTSVIGSGELTLTCPANAVAKASATLLSAQALTGSRQSILARSHVGVAAKTVFFLWATDSATGNKLELKINDQSSTTVTAGYYDGGGATYHFVGSLAYSPGTDGLYMALREASGTTYWEVSTDAVTWTVVGSLANPVATGSMTFEVQHKAYATTSSATDTVVDCFNYKATGAGYHKIEDKTWVYNDSAHPANDGWHLYTEAFCNACGYTDCNGTTAHYACQASDGTVTCNQQSSGYDCTKAHTNCISHITVNCVDSTQHASDGSWILFKMDTDRLTNSATSGWYMNMYRYQSLAFVDADVWTYHLYFKFDNQDVVLQGLEFPINKYLSNGHRLQGAVAWYPVRGPLVQDANGAYKGELKIWGGTSWIATNQYAYLLPSTPSDTSHGFYELSFTVGLHDDQVYYNGFQLGYAGQMSTYSWNNTYGVNTNTSATTARITPAFQIDNNTSDTVTTEQKVWVEGWDIDWADERLP